MAEVLAAAVHARKTTIISGGTGTGKTTMLNALSAFIPEDERLITIEDAAELQLQQPHVARMETRPANVEGHGELRQRDLVKNALRMRPDRVILGECRGECPFGQTNCGDTGCTDTDFDPLNCGMCGRRCGDGTACAFGECVPNMCPPGLELCGSECVDLSSDRLHCGECFHACTSFMCRNFMCVAPWATPARCSRR